MRLLDIKVVDRENMYLLQERASMRFAGDVIRDLGLGWCRVVKDRVVDRILADFEGE